MGNYVQPDYRIPTTAPTAQPGFNRNPLGIGGAPAVPYQQPDYRVPANSGAGVQVENAKNPLGINAPQATHVQAGTTAPVNAATIQVVNKNPLNVTAAQPVYVQPGTANPPALPHGQLSDVLGTS
jgi:hypothetical protein